MSKRAKHDKLAGYETTFVTRVDISDEALGKLKDRITGVVKDFGGEVVNNEDWGKRKLAYKIQKETRGQYTYLAYTGNPGVVAEIERNLRLQETVLRFLTVNLGWDFDVEEYRKNYVSPITRRESDERPGGFREDRGGFRDREDRGGYRDREDRGGFRDRDSR